MSFAAFQEGLWGARPSALGGAFTALADDANAPAYNPAGISLMGMSELTFMYAQLYSGIDFNVGANETSDLGLGYFSYIPRMFNKRYGTFGLSWTNFSASNLYREDTFYLSYANAIKYQRQDANPIFAYGLNVKYLRRNVTGDQRTDVDPVFNGGSASDAVTADLGLIYRPDWEILPGLKFGLAFQNLTEPDIGLSKTDRVPLKSTLGVSYQDRYFRWINPSLDISRRDGRTLVALGWEGWFAKDSLALRLGGDEDRITGGLGYQFKILRSMVMRLDYAILWPFEVEESNGSHRISLTTSF